MNNKITTRTVLVLSAVIMIGTIGTTQAFAWHDWGQATWNGAANGFKCNSFTGLTTHYVTPCTAIQSAATTWNGVSGSTWYLSYTTGTAPIHHQAGESVDDDHVAETVNSHISGKIVGSTVTYDPDYCFEDSANVNSPGTCHDMQSISLHEQGHIQKVDHEWWSSSVMVAGLNVGTQQRTLFTHDIDVLEARYP